MKLIAGIDSSALASILIVVVFILLAAEAMVSPPHHGISVDMPKAWHPVSMPGVLRDDAMKVTVMRDGRVYFGFDRINPDDLAAKIQDRLKDRGVEWKVYIVADQRARWGTVKDVLDGVRSAGILRVAFLVYQRRLAVSFP